MRRKIGTEEIVATGAQTECLLAVQLLAEAVGVVTISGLMGILGKSRSTTHALVSQLRDAGLVDWSEGRHGTLHATVRLVPFGVRRKARR